MSLWRWTPSLAALCAALVLAVSLLAPQAALADGVDGYVELGYTDSTVKSADATGTTTKGRQTEFTQKYYLTLNSTFFPNLRLNAGGIFEKDYSVATTDSQQAKADDIKTNFFSNLILSSKMYNASFGYNRREETQKPGGGPNTSLINEDYTITLGWKPDDFPAIDLRLGRNNSFDAAHAVQDITTDVALLNIKYDPVKQVDLRYSVAYTNPLDRLNATETKDLLQSFRATYTDTLFDKRSSVYLGYNFSHRQTDTTSRGAGEVTLQVAPVNGLSHIEAFTDLPNKDTLELNPALIDGNTAATAGINIGFSPRLGGDNRVRDLGLEFSLGGASTIDALWVFVDRNLSPAVSGSFSWVVYSSDDNLNWALVDPAPAVTFGPFLNRFEIRFSPRTQARYIKVTTNPLNPAVTSEPQFSDIFVTELEAFLVVPASEAAGKVQGTSHIINASAKTRILKYPDLSHDISLYLTHVGPQGLTTYFLTNGLSLNQRLSGVFTVSARVAREDSDQAAGHTGSFLYSASVTAVPLRALSHSLVYSGRTDRKPAGTSDSNSLTLFNKAEIYKGISAYLSLGYTFGTNETKVASTGSLLNFGASFVPHRTLTMNVGYIYNGTTQSGGGKASVSTTSDRVEVSLSYNPVRALYLFSSVSRTTNNAQAKTLTNYGVNFSPFPDGDLQLRFSYNENLGPASEGTTRLIQPSLRWNIRSGTYLDLSYTVTQTGSAALRADSRTFNANLKVAL